jgi:hypothetical protein
MVASIALLAVPFLIQRLGLVESHFIEWEGKVGITLFTTFPLFVLAILQLIRTQQIQRAGYIKDFLAEFRRNNELYSAYYDLVYSYRNEVWDKVFEIAKEQPTPSWGDKPVFKCFEPLQFNRQEGSRLYYPPFFHFSPEESRLDGLLDYFNSLGFYLYEGLIRTEDVVSTLGDYIAVIADRKVIEFYLDYCFHQWEYDEKVSGEEVSGDKIGATAPYRHLSYLLKEFEVYNIKELRTKKSERLEQAIEHKRKEVDREIKKLQEEKKRLNKKEGAAD